VVFEEFWRFLEADKDLVMNGLDLLSFLLVTPEIVRSVRPQIVKGLLALFYAVLFGSFGYILFVSGYWFWSLAKSFSFFQFVLADQIGHLIWTIGWLLIFGIIVHFKDAVVRAGTWLGERALVIGVFMFLVSRAIPFLLAIPNLMFLQDKLE
jgi:hypothetical protein